MKAERKPEVVFRHRARLNMGLKVAIYGQSVIVQMEEHIANAMKMRVRIPTPLQSNRLNMIHKIPAMKKQMPRNGGTTLRMRRYNPLNTAMVPLGNSGVTPPPQNLTAVDIDARINFYGKN